MRGSFVELCVMSLVGLLFIVARVLRLPSDIVYIGAKALFRTMDR